MLFKDLKPGDKFIFHDAIDDCSEGYSIATHIKLQFPVSFHLSFINHIIHEIEDPPAFFWNLVKSQHAFTAIAIHDGFLMGIDDETKVLKLG